REQAIASVINDPPRAASSSKSAVEQEKRAQFESRVSERNKASSSIAMVPDLVVEMGLTRLRRDAELASQRMEMKRCTAEAENRRMAEQQLARDQQRRVMKQAEVERIAAQAH